MKIIFLDIDGVLCNMASITAGYKSRSAPEQDPYGPHADCVAALNHIIENTGALIVVSSTWRSAGLAKMRDTLKRWGVNGIVVGITPRLTGRDREVWSYAERGEEVRRWLSAYGEQSIESFVILDDDSDFSGKVKQRLIRTDMQYGLTMAHAERAIAMLNQRVEIAA